MIRCNYTLDWICAHLWYLIQNTVSNLELNYVFEGLRDGEYKLYKKQTSKSELEKALKGIEVAIEIGGETKDLLKAKEGIEMALKLI